jgi:DNA-binding NarL/FixJ family response regulator
MYRSSTTRSVLLYSVDAIVAHGLRAALEHRGMEVITTSADAYSSQVIIDRTPDVVVLDEAGEDFGLVELRACRQWVRVVMLVTSSSQFYRELLLDAGITPIARSGSVPEIVAAILAARDTPAPDPMSSSRPLVEALTKREREVLKLLVRGWSYPRIGEELQIVAETARSHAKGVCRKLGVEDKRYLIGREDLLD